MVRSLICLALSGSEVEQMCDTLTTPLPGDVHAPHAKLLTQRNNKAEKQACATVFLFLQLQKYQDCCHGWETDFCNRRVQCCCSGYGQLRSILHNLIGILYSSRLILLYSTHSEDRQTVENYLLQTGTWLYWHTYAFGHHHFPYSFILFFCTAAGQSAKILKTSHYTCTTLAN